MNPYRKFEFVAANTARNLIGDDLFKSHIQNKKITKIGLIHNKISAVQVKV